MLLPHPVKEDPDCIPARKNHPSVTGKVRKRLIQPFHGLPYHKGFPRADRLRTLIGQAAYDPSSNGLCSGDSHRDSGKHARHHRCKVEGTDLTHSDDSGRRKSRFSYSLRQIL